MTSRPSGLPARASGGRRLIHLSTDIVFRGDRGGYREGDEPDPVNEYGRSKLEAERRVASLHPGATIVRTSLTQFTILLALFPLVFFGGESIRGFTIAMTFGSIFGMYSSVFIGGPILIYFGLKARGDAPAASKIPKRADGAAV